MDPAIDDEGDETLNNMEQPWLVINFGLSFIPDENIFGVHTDPEYALV